MQQNEIAEAQINQDAQTLMPPGIVSSEIVKQSHTIDSEVLPWLNGEYELSISKCQVKDGTEILLASAIGSSKKLVDAAEGMSDHQSQVANNMFYSRIAGFARTGQSSSIETLPKPATDIPIHVMRNNGGQRVYFAVPMLQLAEGEEPQPVILKLAACDKNMQKQVMKVLSSASDGEMRYKMRKSK